MQKTTVYLDPVALPGAEADCGTEETSACRARPGGRCRICRAPRAAPHTEEPRRVRERPPRSQRARRGAAEGDGTIAVIVADTGAILALLDKGDRHHASVRRSVRGSPRRVDPAVGNPARSRLPGELGVGCARAGGVSRRRRRRLFRGGVPASRKTSFAPTRSARSIGRSVSDWSIRSSWRSPSGFAPMRLRLLISAISQRSELSDRRACSRAMRANASAGAGRSRAAPRPASAGRS